MIKNLYLNLINYIFPPKCFSCKEEVIDFLGLCVNCWPKLNFITSPFCKICSYPFEIGNMGLNLCNRCRKIEPSYSNIFSLLKFDSFSKRLVYNFKYYDQTNLAKFFAYLLYSKYKKNIKQHDILIPVPMHKIKKLWRLYNQADLLAVELSKISKIKVEHSLIKKNKLAKSQTSLNKAQRSLNIAGTFSLNGKNISKKSCLIVDDVFTTGATAEEISKLLKLNGASKISIITVAVNILQKYDGV